MGDPDDTTSGADGTRAALGSRELGHTDRIAARLRRIAAASAAFEPPVGSRIGKYVVERTLGVGGMGIVVAARDPELGGRVAIKLLHPDATADVHAERLAREARATFRIRSEHVVRVLGVERHDRTGVPYIVMEHLEGKDLGAILEARGRLSLQEAVDVTLQVCEAVAAAHALGIVHRDLKPSNFFLTERADGTPLVKVLDFGISKAPVEAGAENMKHTDTRAVFGSPTYMSPEQIRSAKNVDARSDVWSLGVALFEMLTGKLPFVADNVAGLLVSIAADSPTRPSAFVELPVDVEETVLACLEKDPARRLASVGELAVRLAPHASPEAALLAGRAERISRASSIPTWGTVTPGRSAELFGAPPSSAPAPAMSMGSTTTGLATLMRRGDSRLRRVAAAGAGAGVLLVLVGIALVRIVVGAPSSPATSTAASPAPSPAAPEAAAVVPAAASVAASTTESAEPRGDAVNAAPAAASSAPRASLGGPAAVATSRVQPARAAAPKAPVSATPARAPSPPPSSKGADLDSRY